jgi:hypothetical protein
MPQDKLKPTLAEVKALLSEDEDSLRPLVQTVLQELLEAEMTEALGAASCRRRGVATAAATTAATWPAGAPGSPGPVLDRAVRALIAGREGARGGSPRSPCRASRPARSHDAHTFALRTRCALS